MVRVRDRVRVRVRVRVSVSVRVRVPVRVRVRVGVRVRDRARLSTLRCGGDATLAALALRVAARLHPRVLEQLLDLVRGLGFESRVGLG